MRRALTPKATGSKFAADQKSMRKKARRRPPKNENLSRRARWLKESARGVKTTYKKLDCSTMSMASVAIATIFAGGILVCSFRGLSCQDVYVLRQGGSLLPPSQCFAAGTPVVDNEVMYE